MKHRLRQSSGGARATGLTVQVMFILATVGGLLDPSPGQSPIDRELVPFAWICVLCLGALAVRTLVLGVYLAPDRIRVRSWLRTYTFHVSADTRCTYVPWGSWLLTRGAEYNVVQMLRITHTDGGRTYSRSFPATAVRRSRAIAQSGVINAFIGAVTAAPSADVTHDYARGTEWESITKASRDKLTHHAAKHAQGVSPSSEQLENSRSATH